MLLFASGCSHTAGTEVSLQGNFDHTWPALLAEKLGWDHVNVAKSGNCHDTIFQSTIAGLANLANQKPDIAIIQWTNPYRYFVPTFRGNDNLSQKYFDRGLELPRIPGMKQVSDHITGRNNDEYGTFGYHRKKDFLIYVIALQEYFKSNNIRYLMVPWHYFEIRMYKGAKDLVSKIDMDNFLFPMTRARKPEHERHTVNISMQVRDMNTYLLNMGYSYTNIEFTLPDGQTARDAHFGYEGNEAAATIFKRWIDTGERPSFETSVETKDLRESVENTYL